MKSVKSPLHYQSSGYDCVPTTFLNALTYLFERSRIPPILIKKIMEHSLDKHRRGVRGKGKRGTSEEAALKIIEELNGYEDKNFAVKCAYLKKEADLTLSQGSKIITTIKKGGAALLAVHFYEKNPVLHYILAVKTDGEFLYCFDPYYRKKDLDGEVRLVRGEKDINLRISLKRLASSSGRYRLAVGKQISSCVMVPRSELLS